MIWPFNKIKEVRDKWKKQDEEYWKNFVKAISEYNPNASRMNEDFDNLAKAIKKITKKEITIPYKFVPQEKYKQTRIDENFQVCTKALKEIKI